MGRDNTKKYNLKDAPPSIVSDRMELAYGTYDPVLTFEDKFSISHRIKKGIRYAEFGILKKKYPIDDKTWAHLLGVSTKTLERYEKANSLFKPLQSEKLMQMKEVFDFGLSFFENADHFKLWLTTPNFSLGGEKPLDMLSDAYGKDLVMDVLVRAEHGIFI